jgi:hypothetical protein
MSPSKNHNKSSIPSNATSIHSHVGDDDTHGHLALTISAATYTTITSIPFLAPSNPPVQSNYPTGSTAATIMEINCQHLVSQDTYRIYQQTDKSIHNQLIAAVPILYIKTILDDTIR